jgi:hypothetical protein
MADEIKACDAVCRIPHGEEALTALMVRSASSRVSNHEMFISSFETRQRRRSSRDNGEAVTRG